MRLQARLAAVLLALTAAPGCFLDEIDKSMEAYEGGKKPPPAQAAKGGKPTATQAAPAGPSWWETARTLGSEPLDESIAVCRLGGRTEFMRRDDCLSRGGQPD